MSAHQPSLKDQVAAALDWWREAGVDADFSDDATDWLAEQEQAAKHEPSKPAHPQMDTAKEAPGPKTPDIPDLFSTGTPGDLAAFREFWLHGPELALAGNAPRIAPRGEAGAKLMILVATPEAEDNEHLLSGPQGSLLAKILAAMQLQGEEVYFASAVPQALPLADGKELLRAGFAKVLAHHVALVHPTRILAFGTNILPLLGHDAAQQPDSVQEFEANGASYPLLVTEGLEALAGMPRLKARFWRRWLAHLAN